MALKLVFARKAAVAAVFAANFRTWELLGARVRAMFAGVVTLKIRKLFAAEVAAVFGASIFSMGTEMTSLVLWTIVSVVPPRADPPRAEGSCNMLAVWDTTCQVFAGAIAVRVITWHKRSHL